MSVFNRFRFGKTKNSVLNNRDGPAPDPNIVEIPEETAPRKKRYDSAGYLLLHPELRRNAALWTVLYSILFMLLIAVGPGYLYTEARAFIYLFTNYGFLR